MIRDGVLNPTPYLTVPNVRTESERGLLSIAFAPDFLTSGKLYVFAVAGNPSEIRVIEYTVPNPLSDSAFGATSRVVLSAPDLAGNHNGGQLAFGPDGMLYVTIGDDATSANAQDLANLNGKVMRIDPRGGTPYAIPADNPFNGVPNARHEIWAYGLRNPFRASFDPAGRLIIGDVGEGTIEEIDIGARGANYGWPTCEGTCSNAGFTNPFHQYTHSGSPGGQAVIGGIYVRDPNLGAISGRYLFGDFARAELRTLSLDTPGGDPQLAGVSAAGANTLYSFGDDARGCAYVMADSIAYRVAPTAADSPACPLPVPSRPGGSAGDRGTVKILSRSIRASRTGALRLRIQNVGTLACTGSVNISSAHKTRLHLRSKKKTIVFAKASYKSLQKGKTRTMVLHARGAKRMLLTRRGKVAAALRASCQSPGSAIQRIKKSGSLLRAKR